MKIVFERKKNDKNIVLSKTVKDKVAPWVSLVAQRLKRLPAMQETWARSLGWEDPLEKGMATRSRILAWRIPFYTIKVTS